MNKNILILTICVLVIAGTAFAASSFTSFNIPNIRTTLIRYDPFPAAPGSYVNLFIQVDNTGGADANDVRLKIVPTYPFSIDNNSTVTISNAAAPIPLSSDGIASLGTIPSLEHSVVEYKLRVDSNALEGNYPVSIWNQPQTSDSWDIENFNVLVQGIDKLEVSNLTPYIITPGQPVNTTFLLNNRGTALLHDISFSWAEQNNKILPLGSENKRYIPLLNPGESAEVPFTLIADPTATSGVYNLNVNLTYIVGSNITKSFISNVGVFIGGEADFDVSIQDYQTTGISFSVANVGANPTTSVSIKVPDQPDFSVTGSSSSFLGNLNPGDFTLATFQISLRNRTSIRPNGSPLPANASSTNGSPSLKLNILYTDTNGARQTVEKDIPIQIFQLQGGVNSQFQRQGGSGNTSIIVPIVIIVIVIIILFVFRKRVKVLFRRKK